MYAVVDAKNSYTNELGTEIVGATYYISDAASEAEEATEKKTWPTTVGVGSRVLVIPSGNIYMLGPSRTWVKYKGVSIMN